MEKKKDIEKIVEEYKNLLNKDIDFLGKILSNLENLTPVEVIYSLKKRIEEKRSFHQLLKEYRLELLEKEIFPEEKEKCLKKLLLISYVENFLAKVFDEFLDLVEEFLIKENLFNHGLKPDQVLMLQEILDEKKEEKANNEDNRNKKAFEIPENFSNKIVH